MGVLLTKSGKILAAGEGELSTLIEYKSKPVSVGLSRFERSSAGQLAVRYKDGAVGIFVGYSYSDMAEEVRAMHRKRVWPAPTLFGGALPNVGLLPLPPRVEQPEPPEEEPVEEEPAPVHRAVVRRTRVVAEAPAPVEERHAPVVESRKRAGRPAPERIRRVRG